MHLSPHELDKLHINQTAKIAHSRLASHIPLNYPESVALLSNQLLELIREGKYTVAEIMDLGRRILGRRMVLYGVEFLMKEVQVEGTFPDGTKLVTIHNPISTDDGNLSLALHNSFLPLPNLSDFPAITPTNIPGQIFPSPHSPHSPHTPNYITINQGREKRRIFVENKGDRPIQVGSHFHFSESNRYLEHDRYLSLGFRLDIPSGSSVRFEPGERRVVQICRIGGRGVRVGGNGLFPSRGCTRSTGEGGGSEGSASSQSGGTTGEGSHSSTEEEYTREEVEQICREKGFKHITQSEVIPTHPVQLSRLSYIQTYGPTTGDLIRLADTSLIIEVEMDLTEYGDECIFGGGKSIREGMAQHSSSLDGECLDLCITNCIIFDPISGIIKADVGIKSGMIVGIGKAGNPDTMHISKEMVIGAGTEILSGEGKILTAGAIDTHVHFICPQLLTQALTAGVTTVIGGGSGPNTGTLATTCTAGLIHLEMMLRSTDGMPLNVGLTGKGNCSDMKVLKEQIEAGMIGLKIHEDYGSMPQVIHKTLQVCDQYDVQCTLHSDTLNESGYIEDTLQAIGTRSVHAYHSEGAGGGHAPDIIRVVGVGNVVPSSTNPTRPYTRNTIDEHLDMVMVCHHLNKDVPEDVAFAESRIRGETIGAEDVLHDIGAISIISSDSQAMGRIGEVLTRTWQTADKMKSKRGWLSPSQNEEGVHEREYDQGNDNYRVKSAKAHGISHVVGSIEVGKLADLVLWDPAFFAVRPSHVLKSGIVVYAQMGDRNASIPTPQPVYNRPMFGAFPKAAVRNSVVFMSQIGKDLKMNEKYGLEKRCIAVHNCRVGKKDMIRNKELPQVEVDPETYEVKVDGERCCAEPSEEVPMSKLYYIY